MNNENKQPGMAGVGALPLLIILGLIFGVGYFLLQDELKLPFGLGEEKKRIEVRRLDDFPITIPVSKINEQQRIVIKSQEELIKFLANIDAGSSLSIGEKINFDKEYLLGVSSKTLETGGYELKVKRVYIDKEKDEFLVSSTLYKPEDNCNVTEALTIAVDLVAIDKTEKNISFDTQKEFRSCE